MTVEEVIKARGIERLVHFTTTINLLGICEHGGVVPRASFDQMRVSDGERISADYLDHMDEMRLDGLKGYVNTSISHTNWFLLNAYKERKDLLYYDWCVLEIKPEVMTWPDVIFSVCNAASNAAKSYGVRGGGDGLNNLFREEVISNGRCYRRAGLKDSYTTDVQAEVLIPHEISLDSVKSVCFKNERSMQLCLSAFKQEGFADAARLFKVEPLLFGARA